MIVPEHAQQNRLNADICAKSNTTFNLTIPFDHR